ncbi:amino acid ABC transporter permease [Noviherbaspirillum cavernae]|uniref:Amino acid ABC transporter permease n=1 Tax=Noviherbaspirillum cavernae TaxID=2320862 RepID=A0A418WX97_9BURK|nr:amino acid ABC transporter permease [Noviherbaspirillum cavernae]RJG04868.1 amino acid ABC transporter permease [Noviherbaspirillum cavernae]
MDYLFDFGSIWEYREYLVNGILGTLRLTAAGTVLGLAVGILGAVSRAWKLPGLAQLYAGYVELIRNTPFIVQLFFVFFGLPGLGVQLNEWQAATLAMIINLGAYSTEIIRAGIEAVPKGQIEAASALAMSRFQIFRHVVLRQALAKIWPALSSQIIIVMLGSSVCSQISAEELTFGANFIQSRNFRAFEIYLIATALYFMLALLLRHLLVLFGRHVIARRS